MPRRCRPLSASRVFGLVAGLAVTAAAAALWPMPARAQTVAANAPQANAPQANTPQANTLTTPANADADLFLPSLQGSPNNPSRFVARRNTVSANQAPPTGAFTGSAIPPGPPVYGSPTGFGAGDTGFEFHQWAAPATGARAERRHGDRAAAADHDVRSAARTAATAARTAVAAARAGAAAAA